MTRKQATIAVRSGLNDDEQYGCVVPPIHLSSTYNFTGFNEPRAHDYSRRGNPTRDVTQRALAELEGGAGAVLTNTGMSAIHLVTTAVLKPGELLVAPHDCYGGSYRLFDSLAKRGCYRVLFVDQNDEQALKQALAEQPKLVLVESPSNPLLRVVDIAKICQLARDAGAISVVDNTFLSPALQNPLALGADLVLHSCTKYLNGHSDVVAGVVIAGLAATLFSLATGITGWNVSDIESLLTLASTSGIQVGGLLFSGLLISSLGAVMDVAMSIASAIAEIHVQNPALSRRALFRAGMHVGRDMMGTDSNTLILAFAGGSISMLVLDYAYNLPYRQIINSNNIGIAIMQGLSGSFGIVLAVPVTVALAVLLYTWRKAAPAA